ncbi:hypothetical protein EVAR_71951_1 [Eumeta japonica]|uniref:Uncharacterized protein n=1 Tax=Eumeta variegata TaxID=151549 RepID=A0A4C1T5S0_EUMVA|nr:hypothetical protein EVAR_71951_1 [Eumeta japonica]
MLDLLQGAQTVVVPGAAPALETLIDAATAARTGPAVPTSATTFPIPTRRRRARQRSTGDRAGSRCVDSTLHPFATEGAADAHPRLIETGARRARRGRPVG